VTHDIGNMVGNALAAQFPDRVTRRAVIDAPLPGIGQWDEIIRSPALWHFNFRGPDVERLVAGRERIYLDRLWNELSADPKSIHEATRPHSAELYALPGGNAFGVQPIRRLHAGRDRQQDFCRQRQARHVGARAWWRHSFAMQMGEIMRLIASDVTTGVIRDSGHWVMEEQPAQTTAAIVAFIERT
jgi:pimeloyl-ACP methyl ester carboxylesterase